MVQATFRDGVALITGGGSGIGYALAHRLAAQGGRVVIASTSEAKLAAAAAAIRESCGATVGIAPLDVADRAQVRAVVDKVEAEHGPISLMAANAGATTRGRFIDHQDEDWDWSLGVNLNGVTHCIQAVYPKMAARGAGQILITGSQTAYAPDWVLAHGPYVAAKSAVSVLSLALRMEAAEFGVGVSLLVPAATQTEVSNNARQVPPGGNATMQLRKGLPKPLPPHFLSADEVAARAIDGLERDAAIIVTHAGMKPIAEEYFNRILTAYDEAGMFQPDAQPATTN